MIVHNGYLTLGNNDASIHRHTPKLSQHVCFQHTNDLLLLAITPETLFDWEGSAGAFNFYRLLSCHVLSIWGRPGFSSEFNHPSRRSTINQSSTINHQFSNHFILVSTITNHHQTSNITKYHQVRTFLKHSSAVLAGIAWTCRASASWRRPTWFPSLSQAGRRAQRTAVPTGWLCDWSTALQLICLFSSSWRFCNVLLTQWVWILCCQSLNWSFLLSILLNNAAPGNTPATCRHGIPSFDLWTLTAELRSEVSIYAH